MGVGNFMKKVLAVIGGLFCSIIIIAFMTAIPIAHVVIGALYKEECPIEEKIPIYLLVAGSFGLIQAVLRALQTCCKAKNQDGEEKSGERGEESALQAPPTSQGRCLAGLESLIGLFMFAWFICGNVWTYSNYSDVQYMNANQTETYCHQTCYLFAFWSINAVYILMGVGLSFCIIGCCCACFCACCGDHEKIPDV